MTTPFVLESYARQAARRAKHKRMTAAVEQTPALAWLTYPEALVSDFVREIAWKFRRDGELSDRQVETVLAALERDTVRQDEKDAREALRGSGVQAPEGRVIVEGEVVSVKFQENAYGGSLKWTVKTEEGWAVWGTVPSSLDPVKGDRVRFTATLERSDRDPLFAFSKRPAKAEVLPAVP